MCKSQVDKNGGEIKMERSSSQLGGMIVIMIVNFIGCRIIQEISFWVFYEGIFRFS